MQVHISARSSIAKFVSSWRNMGIHMEMTGQGKRNINQVPYFESAWKSEQTALNCRLQLHHHHICTTKIRDAVTLWVELHAETALRYFYQIGGKFIKNLYSWNGELKEVAAALSRHKWTFFLLSLSLSEIFWLFFSFDQKVKIFGGVNTWKVAYKVKFGHKLLTRSFYRIILLPSLSSTQFCCVLTIFLRQFVCI